VGGGIIATSETEVAAMAARPLCKTRCARSRLSARSPSHNWYLVGGATYNIEYQIVEENCDPRADDQEGYEKLQRVCLAVGLGQLHGYTHKNAREP
jgi:hypothetical protein